MMEPAMNLNLTVYVCIIIIILLPHHLVKRNPTCYVQNAKDNYSYLKFMQKLDKRVTDKKYIRLLSFTVRYKTIMLWAEKSSSISYIKTQSIIMVNVYAHIGCFLANLPRTSTVHPPVRPNRG